MYSIINQKQITNAPAETLIMTTEPIKVLCVDDNAVIALGMQVAIDDDPGMRCVGCLYRADELTSEVERSHPDVVVLDARMPGKAPMDALRELSASHPDVRVIIFSGFDDAAAVGQAVEAGARGYVSKRGDTDDVLEAIRAVIRGEFAHSTA